MKRFEPIAVALCWGVLFWGVYRLGQQFGLPAVAPTSSAVLTAVMALCAALSVGSRAFALTLEPSINGDSVARTEDMPNAAAVSASEPISFVDPVLAANLDELLGLELLLDVKVERYPGRYDIVFQDGKVSLEVSVFFASKTYQVGGDTQSVSARSREDVWHAASVFSTVKCFLTTLSQLGVRDSQEVVPVAVHGRAR